MQEHVPIAEQPEFLRRGFGDPVVAVGGRVRRRGRGRARRCHVCRDGDAPVDARMRRGIEVVRLCGFGAGKEAVGRGGLGV